jgi:shikimate dehydrogenase
MTIRCAVLGSPIEHSLSPALHRAGYAALGLTGWEYQRHLVDEAQLGDFVAGLDGSWRGLSLTMPLKQAALGLGEPDPLCLFADAANTLIIDRPAGAPARRLLYNTDVPGLVDAFAAAGVAGIETATILGSGATARSAMISVARMGARRVQLVARRAAHAREKFGSTANTLDVELDVSGWPSRADPDTGEIPAGVRQLAGSGSAQLLPAADVLISTVVAGAADSIAVPASRAAPVIFDVIYEPWPTGLASAAGRNGATVLNGLDLLVHQAVGQLALMTGRRVDPDVLLEAGRRELTARES